MDSKYEGLIKRLALKYNVSFNVMKAICESQFEFTSTTLREMDLTNEDINNSKTNFRWKGIGTLYASEKLKQYIKKYGNKDKGDN